MDSRIRDSLLKISDEIGRKPRRSVELAAKTEAAEQIGFVEVGFTAVMRCRCTWTCSAGWRDSASCEHGLVGTEGVGLLAFRCPLLIAPVRLVELVLPATAQRRKNV